MACDTEGGGESGRLPQKVEKYFQERSLYAEVYLRTYLAVAQDTVPVGSCFTAARCTYGAILTYFRTERRRQ